jgi:hypothetical protein
MPSVENKFNALPKLPKLPLGREWTYFLRADCEAKLVKIGHSVNLKWRLTGLQTQCPVQLSLIGLVQAPAGTELVLHETLATSRAHGEWFRPTPELEAIRAAMPKAASIETPDLVRIVAPLGVTEDRVQELLVWALSTAKHTEGDEPRRRRHEISTIVEMNKRPPALDFQTVRVIRERFGKR